MYRCTRTFMGTRQVFSPHSPFKFKTSSQLIFSFPSFSSSSVVNSTSNNKIGHGSNDSGRKLLYRDLFIHDETFSITEFMNKIDVSGGGLKHPKSKHIVLKYLNYMYMNSSYNFNSLGEYSVNITAVQPLPSSSPSSPLSSNSTSTTTPSSSSSKSSSTHNIIIWPDRLLITNLTEEDIPTILKTIMNDNDVANIENLQDKLSKVCKITKILDDKNEVMYISSQSKNIPITAAFKVLQWFQQVLIENNNKKMENISSSSSSSSLPSSPSPLLYLGDILGGHRNATNVLILPHEDSFELSRFGTIDQVRKLLIDSKNFI